MTPPPPHVKVNKTASLPPEDLTASPPPASDRIYLGQQVKQPEKYPWMTGIYIYSAKRGEDMMGGGGGRHVCNRARKKNPINFVEKLI